MQKDWMRYVWVLTGLGVLAIIAIILQMSTPSAAPSAQSAPSGFPEYVPPPQAKDVVAAQHGFDALVSIADSGFEPSSITIKKGETIRFTNNTSAFFRLFGMNAIEIDGAVPPRGYTEITFTEAGTFELNNEESVRVVVTVQ